MEAKKNIPLEDYSIYELKIYITHDSDGGFVGLARYEYPNGKPVFVDEKPLTCTASSFNRMDILHRLQEWAMNQEYLMIERYLNNPNNKIQYKVKNFVNQTK